MGILESKNKGILLLSAGSKVAIARIAKSAAAKRGLSLHASDRIHNVPTQHFADRFVAIDDTDRKSWLQSVLNYCEQESIGLVIPTRHSDLPYLATAATQFQKRDIGLSLSSQEAIRICSQKLETARFLQNLDCPSPQTHLKQDLENSALRDVFPLFAKPAAGASSLGARKVNTESELAAVPNDWILQSLVRGQEYTANLYLSRDGTPLCVIPHRRIAVESGEVSQAQTQRLAPLIELSSKIARELPGAQGIITIQAFHDPQDDSLQIIEINPRIGGGYPLADQAKGRYIEWLCQEWLDNETLEPFEQWTENLLMMRYREAVFSL